MSEEFLLPIEVVMSKGLDTMPDPAFLMSGGLIVWQNTALKSLYTKENKSIFVEELESLISREYCPHSCLSDIELNLSGSNIHAKCSITPIAYDGAEFSLVLMHLDTGIKLKKLEQEVRKDVLTGALNKLGFNDALNQKFMRVSLLKAPLTLIYLDLDRFKPINDTYGHKAGDQVLIHFVHSATQAARQGDLVARLGGDEFALLIDGDEQVAISIIERLSNKDDLVFDGNLLDYGFSFGISTLKPGMTIDDLLRKADMSMYENKKNKTAKNVVGFNRYLIQSFGSQGKKNMPFPLTLPFIIENTIDNIPNTEIKPSSLHGYGLFATADISVSQMLCKVTGQLMSKEDYQKLVKNLTPMTGDLSFYFLMECNHVPNPNLLMVRSFRTKWSYLNHSNDPNCYFDVMAGVLHPLRDIKKGEELTFDYRNEPLDQQYLQSNQSWLGD